MNSVTTENNNNKNTHQNINLYWFSSIPLKKKSVPITPLDNTFLQWALES